MQVIGSVEIVFFPLDDDSLYVGMNTTSAGRAIAYINEGKLDKVVIPDKSTGVFYPMSQRPPESCYLENFVWFDYVRPLDKEDVFRWRGKDANRKLKIYKRESVPLPSLDRFRKEEE